jgi:hypothetical protein
LHAEEPGTEPGVAEQQNGGKHHAAKYSGTGWLERWKVFGKLGLYRNNVIFQHKWQSFINESLGSA